MEGKSALKRPDKFHKQEILLQDLEVKIEKLDQSKHKIIPIILQLDEDVKDLKEKIKKLDLFDAVLAGQDTMIRLLTKMDQEITLSNVRFQRIERTQNTHDRKIASLDNKIATVEARLQTI